MLDVIAELEGPIAAALAPHWRARGLAAGEVLFAEGSQGESLYRVVAGRLVVHVSDCAVAELGPGSLVGEMALLTGQPRTGTVSAVVATDVVELSREALDASGVTGAVVEALLPRARRIEVARTLSTLFGAIEPATLDVLARATRWQELAPGERLFAQGDVSDAMYVVIHGRLRATVDGVTGPQPVGEIGASSCVGELGLLTDETRSATITAVRHTAVGRLDRADFDRVVEAQPAVMVPIARWMARRSRETLLATRAYGRGQASPNASLTLVLLPCGGREAADQVALDLERALDPLGGCLRLGPETFERLTGRVGAANAPLDGPTDRGLRAWLTERERWVNFIVYVADDALPNWTRRCLRQADRALLVAHASAPRATSPSEAVRAELAPHTPLDLVLVHPASTTLPSETSTWLRGRSIDTIAHLRAGQRADSDRLARRLARTARALVLGGGGARGLSHAGVLEVCEEVGLDFDLVGGTSMGALVGGLVALQRPAQALRDALTAVSRRRLFLDYTLPVAAFTRSEAVNGVLRGLFGDVDIEDLWLPYFCVATNVSRSTPTVHTRGPLWRAVRSSLSVPGLFAPIVWDGDVLVDGGIMNNLPLDLMRARCGRGPLLAVNVGAEHHPEPMHFPDSNSGWRLLWNKLLGRRDQRVPSLVGTVVRTMVVNSEHTMQRLGMVQLADLVIEPDIQRFGFLQFEQHAVLMEEGRRAAQAHRERLRALAG